MMFLSSPFLCSSLFFVTNKKREKDGCRKSCHEMVVKISLLIIELDSSTLKKKNTFFPRKKIIFFRKNKSAFSYFELKSAK